MHKSIGIGLLKIGNMTSVSDIILGIVSVSFYMAQRLSDKRLQGETLDE